MRVITSFIIAIFMAVAVVAPATAQDAATDAEWQLVITHQIQAFRDKDAPAAFGDASSVFQLNFPTAEMFFNAIITSGYESIMTSRSHSYGPFELDESGAIVMQVVNFIGPDQELFTGLYNLIREEAGWRVQAVALTGPKGLGV